MEISRLTQYISKHLLPRWIILLLDMLTVVFSCLIAYVLFLGVLQINASIPDLVYFVSLVFTCTFFSFYLFKTYAGVLRYSSFLDILRIFVALTVAYVGAFVSVSMLASLHIIQDMNVPIVIIAMITNFTLMSSGRVIVKLTSEKINFDGRNSMNVFIYGVKDAGVAIAKSLRVERGNHYKLCGFIADEQELIGKIMMGVTVYGNNEGLLNVLLEKNVEVIVVSPLKMQELAQSDLLDKLLNYHVKLVTAPPMNEWNENLPGKIQLRDIKFEDLLQRPSIQINKFEIASHIEGRRVMVTGAAGSIGSEIVRQVAAFNPYQIILIDQAESPLHDMRIELHDNWSQIDCKTIVADIQNFKRMEMIFKEYKPQYIFHAAAYKHVPMMEDNVSESIQTNVHGTKNIADLAVKYGAEKFVMISTDKAVNPTNIMGCSKRLAEIYVQSLAKKLKKEGVKSVQIVTTRFGNVLGSNGSVVPRFTNQIEKGGPVTVTHPEIVRYFMTIPEACNLVLEAGSMGSGGEIYVFDMGKPVKIVDLARRMINLSGRNDIKIEFMGLRHGEKLYEELLNTKETTKPTHHEKIMIAKVREYDYDKVSKDIQSLIEASFNFDTMETVRMMKKIVPEFLSKNSEFEVLDIHTKD
ncbi:MAG: nucleoside-diphosphate sugar epimerase/dehydratase [Bacteroidales bacterium]|nr:nucleoside-diphosphate sugar epimerase/dehydratase [Bacteroidales bacterium]